MSLPKVLIINQPFNMSSGGGITLSNLFRGWDKDKLAVACSGHFLQGNINPQICNNYYQQGHKEIRWIFPFNYLQHKYFSGPRKFEQEKTQKPIAKSRLREKMVMHYFIPFLRYIGLDHCISRTKLSEDFCNWVNDYNPDVIYAQAFTRDGVLFCIDVSNYLKKPLIFHMMDDWPTLVKSKGLFRNYWHKKIDHEFRIMLGKASLLLCISDYMSYEYKKRYGKDFITFHNPIDIDFWGKYKKTDYELGDPITILYAGRIGLGINTSIENIAKAVQSLNKEFNLNVKFCLQTKEKPSWVTNYPCIECLNFVSYNELPGIFSEVDFLILPYDFSMKSIKFVQYSMPTKVPEYMISGTPIIIFAPEVTALVRYAKEYNLAKIVTTNNVNVLSNAIKQLIQNKEERQSMGQNAKRIAEERHNSIKVTNDFKKLICSI